MFGFFKSKAKKEEEALLKALSEDPIQVSLLEYIQEHWHGEPILAKLSAEAAQNNFEEIFTVLQSMRDEDSLQPLRNAYYIVVNEYTKHAVLALNEAQKIKQGYAQVSGFSGELCQHLTHPNAADLSEHIEKFKFNFPDASEELLLEVCEFKLALSKFHLGAYEIIRTAYQDTNQINPEKDWGKVYQLISLEYWEQKHRKVLGLDVDEEYNQFRYVLLSKYVIEEQEPLMMYERSLTKLEQAD